MIDRSEQSDVLPDWFTPELYKYESTSEYWLQEIERRLRAQVCAGRADKDLVAEFFLKTVIHPDDDAPEYGKIRENIRRPVSTLSVFEAVYFTKLAMDDRSQQRSFELASMCAKDPEKALLEVSRDQIDEINKPDSLKNPASGRNLYFLNGRVPCSIDIELDDKTLKKAFEDWLAYFRGRPTLTRKLRNPIEKKEFSHWSKFRVLTAFDLQFWSQLGFIKLTDAVIGRLLWPDQDPSKQLGNVVDTTGRYRKTTKPLVNHVISWRLYERLRYQWSLAKWALEKKQQSENNTSI